MQALVMERTLVPSAPCDDIYTGALTLLVDLALSGFGDIQTQKSAKTFPDLQRSL